MNATLLRALKVLPLMAAMAMGGCAPKDWDSEYDGAYDPLEGLNRKTFALNKGIDTVLLKPAARAYILLPEAGRDAVGRAINNLTEPASAVNNLLQFKPEGLGGSLARFTVNSTFGVLGLFDPATKMGLPRQREDLGQTIRRYGWHSPPHLVLPLVGPSSLADAVGFAGDSFLHPEQFLTDAARIGLGATTAVHIRSEFLEKGEIAEEAALDEYSFIRDLYEDSRNAEAVK